MPEIRTTFGIVYEISGVNGCGIYVGSTIDQGRRWKDHRYCLRTNTHRNQPLNEAWTEHGSDNFEFKVIHSDIPEADLTTQEAAHIASLQQQGLYLYNSWTPPMAELRTLADPATPDIPYSLSSSRETRKQKRLAQLLVENPNDSVAQIAEKAGTSRETAMRVIRSPLGKELQAKAAIKHNAVVKTSTDIRSKLIASLAEQVEAGTLEGKDLLMALKVSDDLVKTDRELGTDITEEVETERAKQAGVKARLNALLAGLLLHKLDPEAGDRAIQKLLSFYEVEGWKPPMTRAVAS